jgi:tryptophan-rich sensory protein
MNRESKHALVTFIYAAVFFGLAILLSFLGDWCVSSKRPGWLCAGVEFFSIWMFLIDGLILIGISVRWLCRYWSQTVLKICKSKRRSTTRKGAET